MISVSKHDFLRHLRGELSKDDVLLQLNALEIVADLAQPEHGLAYLDETNAIGELEVSLDNVATSPMGSLLVPGFVKLFGKSW